MTVDTSSDARHEALARSVCAAPPEPELRRLASEVHESRLLTGHLPYDPEVTIVATGLIRAFMGDDTGRQATSAYLRPDKTLSLAHLAGRRYPVAFQAITNSRLIVIGNDRARQFHAGHAALGWATIQALRTRYLHDLETELASSAFGSLRQRLPTQLLAPTADRDGTRPPVHVGVPVTAVGSSREVISRILAPLADDGTLRIDTSGVTITNRHQLRDHANIDCGRDLHQTRAVI